LTHLLADSGVWHKGQCTSTTGDSSPMLCKREIRTEEAKEGEKDGGSEGGR
jgi:hypothetical protein